MDDSNVSPKKGTGKMNSLGSNQESRSGLKITKVMIDQYRSVFVARYSSAQLITMTFAEFENELLVHAQKIIAQHINKNQALEIFIQITSTLRKTFDQVVKKARCAEGHVHLIERKIDPSGMNQVEKIRAYLKDQEGRDDDSDVRSMIIQRFGEARETVSPGLIDACIINRNHELRKERIETLTKTLSYDGTPFEEAIDRFSKLLGPCFPKGYPEERLKIDAHVFYHFVWQVKRKMRKLQVDHHMYPILFSRGGKGKSKFVENFCQPIRDWEDQFYDVVDIRSIVDEKHQIDGFAKLVLFFDEMQNANTTNFEGLKRVISSQKVSVRKFHTQSKPKTFNYSTGIGASNKANLAAISPEMQGERRFYPMHVNEFIGVTADEQTLRELGHLSEEQIKAGFIYPKVSFNATVFWTIVDELSECSLDIPEIRKVQDGERVRAGIEELTFLLQVEPGYRFYPAVLIYQQYLELMVKSGRGMQVLTDVKFYRELSEFVKLRYPDSFDKVIYHGKRIPFKHRGKSKDVRDIVCFRMRQTMQLDAATKSFTSSQDGYE